MSQEKELREVIKEIIIVEKIEDTIESLELETQTALSMVKLNVPVLESFAQAFMLIDELSEYYKAINNKLMRSVAFVKIKNALDEFEEKLDQI